MMEFGVQYVTTLLPTLMPRLSADSWDSQRIVRDRNHIRVDVCVILSMACNRVPIHVCYEKSFPLE